MHIKSGSSLPRMLFMSVAILAQIPSCNLQKCSVETRNMSTYSGYSTCASLGGSSPTTVSSNFHAWYDEKGCELIGGPATAMLLPTSPDQIELNSNGWHDDKGHGWYNDKGYVVVGGSSAMQLPVPARPPMVLRPVRPAVPIVIKPPPPFTLPVSFSVHMWDWAYGNWRKSMFLCSFDSTTGRQVAGGQVLKPRSGRWTGWVGGWAIAEMDPTVDTRGFIVIKVKGLPICTISGAVRHTKKIRKTPMRNLMIGDESTDEWEVVA